MHHNIIISDASCIIALENIGHLYLLENIFGKISLTPEVLSEVGFLVPSWIQIIEAIDKKIQYALELTLDKGEASSIALALENKDCILLIDEIKGRKMALKLGLQITGTIGIVLSAKEQGFIQKVAPLISQLNKIGFYISKSLEKDVLKKAGEL